ncbi:MAG: AMMECR1 domain-containing protein, partial [Actinobacteria bacterium]
MIQLNDLKKIIKQLAKEAVENYILKGIIITSVPKHPFLEQKSASFVSLKINDKLRGCLGTIEPQEEFFAKEIINNAINGSTKDYSFTQVQADE